LPSRIENKDNLKCRKMYEIQKLTTFGFPPGSSTILGGSNHRVVKTELLVEKSGDLKNLCQNRKKNAFA
jgi:hypothetical protein